MNPFFLAISMSLSLAAHADTRGGGGDHVNNGGGLAEQNFIYAYQNVAAFTENCLHPSNVCALTEKERRTLSAINTEAKERKDNTGLVFKSGKLNPGLFETDEHGKVRVAVTALTKFSTIYVNLDLIYSDGVQPVVDTYGAFSILVHELGHHTGETDHLFLDQLGNKVRGFREKFLETIDLRKFQHAELKVLAHNHDRNISEQRGWLPYPRTLLSLENGHELLDLTTQLEKLASCRDGERRRSTHYTNMTWHRLEAYDPASKRQAFTFSLDLDFECTSDKQRLDSVRIVWRGLFKVMELTSSGELVDSNYPENWQIYDRIRFQLDTSEAKAQ